MMIPLRAPENCLLHIAGIVEQRLLDSSFGLQLEMASTQAAKKMVIEQANTEAANAANQKR